MTHFINFSNEKTNGTKAERHFGVGTDGHREWSAREWNWKRENENVKTYDRRVYVYLAHTYAYMK